MAKKPKQTEEQKEQDRAAGEAARWKTEIRLYEREAEQFTMRGKKIVKRFKDDRSKGSDERKNKFNILWSNVQTLSPALFAKNPIVNVERRFQSDDDVGRFAAQALERATAFFVDDKYFDCIKEVVQDRLLPGRGTSWVRYIPKFAEGADTDEEQAKLPEVTDDDDQSELVSEELVCDYVHWQDFGHTYARTWEEVDAVWRRVYMSRDALEKRFPQCGKDIPLDHAPEKLNDEKIPTEVKKATIYEIWSQKQKKAIWVHKDYSTVLDEIDDPLKLKEFFPCPRPLFASLANDSIIPVPDYAEYQDQADELDELTARINLLTKAVKVAGVYAGDVAGVQRLLSEGLENEIIPIDNWAMFAEKGGLKGVIDYLPLEQIVKAIAALYESRERVKKDLYEISGLSDIIRGEGDARETATGVKTKGQFGTMRLNAMQSEVHRYNRDMVRIMGEIICTHFSPETIKELSGIQLMTAQEKQQVQQQLQQQAMMAQQQPQQPGQPPPPIPEKLQEALDNPTWEDVFTLLKNDTMRAFRIDIEIDSTIKMDQDKERQDRGEFLQAAGGFLQQMETVQDPALKPLMMEMLMFGIRSFHVAKDLESVFEVAQKKITKDSQNPQQKPDPEMAKTQGLLALEKMKMQAQQQADQADIQVEQAKAAKDAQFEQSRMQADMAMEAQKFNQQRELDSAKLQHESLKLNLSHALELKKIASSEKIAKVKAKGDGKGGASADSLDLAPEPDEETKLDKLQQDQQQATQGIGQAFQQQQAIMEQQMKALLQLAQGQAATLKGIQETIAAIKAPKRVVRDAKGRVAGVEVAQ